MVTVTRMTAEPVGLPPAALGEGARWDRAAGLLRFVDYDAPALHAYDPTRGETATVDLAAPFAAFAARADGSWVATGRRGFVAWTADRGIAPLGPQIADGDGTWVNDGRCDAHGRFWAATATRGGAGDAALYRLDADGTVMRMLDGLGFGNGIGFGPDGTTLYLADTFRRVVLAVPCDPDAGTLGEPRTFVELPADDGVPDGLAVDVEGGVWVAICGAGEVRRYAPDGRLLAVVAADAALVTSCALGGPNGDELFVTSGNEIVTSGPLAGVPLGGSAGRVFRVRVGVEGLPEEAFAG